MDFKNEGRLSGIRILAFSGSLEKSWGGGPPSVQV